MRRHLRSIIYRSLCLCTNSGLQQWLVGMTAPAAAGARRSRPRHEGRDGGHLPRLGAQVPVASKAGHQRMGNAILSRTKVDAAGVKVF